MQSRASAPAPLDEKFITKTKWPDSRETDSYQAKSQRRNISWNVLRILYDPGTQRCLLFHTFCVESWVFFFWFCMKKLWGMRCHNTTVGLNTVCAAVRTEIRAKLMPPTHQPVNANQNDKHVMVPGQLYTTCQPSSSFYCHGTHKKPLQESDSAVISPCRRFNQIHLYILPMTQWP